MAIIPGSIDADPRDAEQLGSHAHPSSCASSPLLLPPSPPPNDTADPPVTPIPQPRQSDSPAHFSLTPLSTPASSVPSPSFEPLGASSAPTMPTSDTPQKRTPNLALTPLNTASTAASPTDVSGSGTPQKSRSILNLTSSTLFGIYAPTSNNDISARPSSTSLYDQSEPLALHTPWSPGARTPALSSHSQQQYISPERLAAGLSAANGHSKQRKQRRSSFRTRRSAASVILSTLARVAALALMGVAYGAFITHLHDERGLAPVHVNIEHGTAPYLGFWGGIAVILGLALPGFDGAWGSAADTRTVEDAVYDEKRDAEEVARRRMASRQDSLVNLGADWNPIVRSVGAFVGIAFAIRKLPWQSTLQLSLTLALVNPCIWYLIDRTRTGFTLSTVVGLAGAALLMSANPAVVPPPIISTSAAAASPSATSLASSVSSFLQGWAGRPGAHQQHPTHPEDAFVLGLVSYESFGAATWIGSVLFCSCIFFGNVGRRLWASSTTAASSPSLVPLR